MKYLLLRDNKETGPYALADLLELGLKPYDLVWVPGKSAAWRYPSEIEELKPYAPVVEEQPFDRFFKKPDNGKAAVAEASPLPGITEAMAAYAPKVETVAAEQKAVAKRSVFVTLPGQRDRKPAAATTAAVKATPVPKPAPVPIPDYTQDDYTQEEPPAETIRITENPAAKINHSQPLDEIRDMYRKTLQDRKDRIARNNFWKLNLKRAAVVGGLIGLGILAGFLLRPGPDTPRAVAAASPALSSGNIPEMPAANEEQPGLTEETTPAGTEPVTQEPASVPSPLTQTLTLPQKNTPEDQPPHTVNPNPNTPSSVPPASSSRKREQPAMADKDSRKPLAVMPPVTRSSDPDPSQQSYTGVDKDPITGERSRTMRSAGSGAEEPLTGKAEQDQPAAAPERNLAGLDGQVAVTSNDYKRVALGGIRNLELTVTNRSKYNLDQVTVELQYLKPNEQKLKSEMIQFKSVAANESTTIRVPDTNRGVKVQFRIVKIGGKHLNNEVAGN